MNDICILEMNISDNKYDFTSSIESASAAAEAELQSLNETIDSVQHLRPECDKLDYTLAACSGALCGIIDIFLVGKPGESPIGEITDQWFENRVKDFARICGWPSNKNGDLNSAIRFLENKFKIPYDQSIGQAGRKLFHLTPRDHHFKSLAHNPSLLGLFFSILDQFTNSSHFVTDGRLISLVKSDDGFELRGGNIAAKLFSAIANWFGHLMSDVSGSSTGKGRGMGIPSPLWTWINDIIALKHVIGVTPSLFDENIYNIALEIFDKGFDLRFQAAQTIPVLINELVVRLMYSIRRLIKYFRETEKGSRSLGLMWKHCEPFSNATVKRMLTVAHGTFCIIDIGDAAIRGFISGAGTFDPVEFFLRLNIAGVGRFTISLYGEAKRTMNIHKSELDAEFAKKEKVIVENYLCGLRVLSDIYDDRNLTDFVNDLQNSELYIQAFHKSVLLAEKRNVPENKLLKTKSDIDHYFLGGSK